MSAQDSVWRLRMVALPFWPFELSPLNEFYKGKLVPSIAPYTYEIF